MHAMRWWIGLLGALLLVSPPTACASGFRLKAAPSSANEDLSSDAKWKNDKWLLGFGDWDEEEPLVKTKEGGRKRFSATWGQAKVLPGGAPKAMPPTKQRQRIQKRIMDQRAKARHLAEESGAATVASVSPSPPHVQPPVYGQGARSPAYGQQAKSLAPAEAIPESNETAHPAVGDAIPAPPALPSNAYVTDVYGAEGENWDRDSVQGQRLFDWSYAGESCSLSCALPHPRHG
jgi:hypothetical protein